MDLDGASGGDGAAGGCPGVCTSCLGDGTCVITCAEGECLDPIVCPEGRPCQITCTGYTACENTPIDCLAATSCDISCLGHDACQVGIQCAGSSCTVVCDGTDACSDAPVDCVADVCNIGCYGSNACTDGVCCGGAECGGMCTILDDGCCTCGGCAN